MRMYPGRAISAKGSFLGTNQNATLTYVPVTGSSVIPGSAVYSGWTTAGVIGGIPHRTTIYTTLAASVSTATIQAALNACPSGQVVKIGAGTHTLTATLNIPSNVTLRGNGMLGGSKTSLAVSFSTGGHCVKMGDGNGGWPHATTGVAITVAVPRETNVITCNPASFTVGDLVVMYIDGVVGDDPVLDIDVSGVIPVRRTSFRSTVTAKDAGAGTVTLYDQLPFALPLALNPTIAVVPGGTGFTFKAGLEDLEVDCMPG
jgi:hypothetical protein